MEEKDIRKYDSIQSAAAAIQNMHLAAHALGLGSVWVCAMRNLLKLNQILDVPKQIRPVAIVALGYPDENPVVPTRRTLNSVVHFERFRGIKDSYINSVNPADWSIRELAEFRSRICWYGGTLRKDNTLEPINMDNPVYHQLMNLIREEIKKCKIEKMLDILPFAGGFLVGMLKDIFSPEQMTVFELHKGNADCIRKNLKNFKLPEPSFNINQGDSIAFNMIGFHFMTCFYRLEKVPRPEAMLYEMSQCLKKNGRLFLVTELQGLSGIYNILHYSKEKNLHTSRLWCMGPERRFSKSRLFRMLTNDSFRILKTGILRDSNLFKSIAKQILRGKGKTLFVLLEKK